MFSYIKLATISHSLNAKYLLDLNCGPFFLIFIFYFKLFVCLFVCLAASSLRHAGSSLQRVGSCLVVAAGFLFSSCCARVPEGVGSVVCGTRAL